MTEKELKQMLIETKVELETLKTLLIQRGKLNSFEYEILKKKISEEFSESKVNEMLQA